MNDLIPTEIKASIAAKQALLATQLANIHKAGELLTQSLGGGKKVLLCGNGGSAADAQHIAAELMIRYKSTNDRPSLPALSLASDASTVTACGNDYGYEALFSRQIEGLGNEGDSLIGITTSGNSPNIIAAVKAAKQKQMHTIVLCGSNTGKISHLDDGQVDCFVYAGDYPTARIQECHILIGHILCSVIEKNLFGMT